MNKVEQVFQNAGDVNNDGKDDLNVGAPLWNSSIGRAYVVYGQSVSPQCPMKMYLSGNRRAVLAHLEMDV